MVWMMYVQFFIDNGIDATKHEFYRKDVFEALPKMKLAKRSFDVILLDPPTLSNIKRRDGN
jgi:23S rRNA G2069 N7-methylase RlmK/C1962 C5-methylase RlmI